MADLLSGGVMRGLLAANIAMKQTGVAMNTYSVAKAKGDNSTMSRALGYANESNEDINDALKESRKALAENAEAKRESDKAEEAARLEKIKEETSEKNKMETEGGIEKRTDTVEISPEAIAAQQKGQNQEVQTADIGDIDISISTIE